MRAILDVPNGVLQRRLVRAPTAINTRMVVFYLLLEKIWLAGGFGVCGLAY